MSKNGFEEPTVEELKAAEKVINTERKERGKETLSEAFVNRIKETMEIGDTGYTREVLLPIPLELIQADTETRNFIKVVGEISRDKTYGLPVYIEEESVQGVDIMNIVMKPSEETNVEAIKNKLNLKG